MDINEALKNVKKLYEEKELFHQKKIKAKRKSLICLIIGVLFLIAFIVMLCISLNNHDFKNGTIIFIILGVIALIFLESAIVFFVFAKSVYGLQEENRKKLLEYINKEVNNHKK